VTFRSETIDLITRDIKIQNQIPEHHIQKPTSKTPSQSSVAQRKCKTKKSQKLNGIFNH
jgi:hypothetical protein